MEKILSIIYSLIICLRLFGIKGFCIPILISYKTRCHIKRGSIVIRNPQLFGIKYGFGGSEGVVENAYSYLGISDGGVLEFLGTATFARGSSVRIDGGHLVIGSCYSSNKNCFISCCENIIIGEHALLGWNINIRDSDGHSIIYPSKRRFKDSSIVIGSHVWIASYVDILKGVTIGDDSMIAYRSCVIGNVEKSNCLIAGSPAKIIRDNISWEK